MDISLLRKKFDKPNRKMKYTIGNQIHFKLFNFKKPIRKFKHEKTDYVLYECKIIKRDGKDLEPRKHLLQIPVKNVWCKLYDLIEEQGRLDEKELLITIVKIDNFNYNITLHNT